MPQWEDIRDVMAEAGRPMSPSEIEQALTRKGKTIGDAQIRARLQENEKGGPDNGVKRSDRELFVRDGRGIWKLADQKPVLNGGHVVVTEKSAAPTTTLLNLLLEGVPGVGKTYRIGTIVSEIGAERVRGNGAGEYAITMHPATTYEEFVEGLRPALSGTSREARNDAWCAEKSGRTPVVKAQQRGSADLEDLTAGRAWFWQDHGTPPTDAKFVLEDGFFLRVCAEAVHFPDHYLVVLLDEFNRCNIPKVLGDLLTSLESSKRARWTGTAWDVSDCPRPTLPASKRLFFVPDNVIVVATMNTSDRSVGGLDAALRRRFAFERIWPHGFDPHAPQDADGVLKMILGTAQASTPPLQEDQRKRLKESVDVWHALNTRLQDIGPDALLGHSYLYDLRKALENTAAENKDRRFALGDAEQAVKHVWLQQIMPQLCEILDVNHQQRSEDLTPYNDVIELLGLDVRLAPPNGRSVHGAVHITRTA